MVFTLPANLVEKRKKSPRETEEDFKPKEKIPQQKEKQVVTPPQLPPPAQVPLPSAFATESPNIVQVVKGSDGSIFLQRLRPSQQQGITAPGGLTAEQQAIESQNILLERQKSLMPGLGQLGVLTPEQQALDVVQGEGAVGMAATGGAALAGGIAGARTGAAIGSVIPGVGTIGGGIAGGIIGAVGGGYTKISFSKRQDVKQAFSVFTTSASNMDWIIKQVNSGMISPNNAIQLWNAELANFNSAERNLKQDTDSDIDRFLSGGMDERAKLEAFKRTLPFLQQQLSNAILNPNPAAVIEMQNFQELIE